MDMYWRPVLSGALSLVPGANQLTGRSRRKGTGGTNAASYCYGVWLKHLTLARSNGMQGIPGTVAELGPGDSIGTGLAAMLSGSNHYFAFDIIQHANIDMNLRVFDELVGLFRARTDRPSKGWPDFDGQMGGKLFPHHILTPQVLEGSLSADRVEAIRQRIQDPSANTDELSVRYMVPWRDPSIVRPGSVDLILSHSCLEHVDALDATYEAMRLWLRPGGFMTHQIDYTDHGLARNWNGYRTCPEWAWRLTRGKGYFLINREPHSVHLEQMRRHELEVVCDMRFERVRDSVERAALAPKWRSLDDADLYCASAFVQARKRVESRG
jgi:SAM-dependent methyltransferase